MDDPICYGPHREFKKANYPDPNRTLKEAKTLDERYFNALVKDDRREFLRIIKDPEFGRAYADEIFRNDALHIGIAVLDGEAEGIIDQDTDWTTLLHQAVYHAAPRLTNYILQSGADIDACLGEYNALGLALQRLGDYQKETLFDTLLTLCHSRREHLEVIRLLVRITECPMRMSECSMYVRETFVKYTDKTQLAPLAVLFLAAPEFFFSAYKKVTDIHDSEEVTLLLDIIDVVGDKLVAYIRLRETSDQIIQQSQMEIAFLLHQVSPKKLGVSSPDYFFRFFKPLTSQPHKQCSDDKPVLPKTWDDLTTSSFGVYFIWFIGGLILTFELVQYSYGEEKPGPWMYKDLKGILDDNIDKAEIYRWLPTLEPCDEGRLERSIQNKLSSMCRFRFDFDDWLGNVKERSFKRNVQSLPAYVPSANRMVDLKIASTQTQTWENKVMKLIKPTQTWENKVMKLIKPKFNFLVMLSYFPTLAKRLIK